MRSYETHGRYRVTEQDNRLLCDIAGANLVGGQGRDAEDVRNSGKIGGWLLLIAVVVGLAWLFKGCATVEGFGRDLSAASRAVGNNMNGE
jgi:predicted small secreted protein